MFFSLLLHLYQPPTQYKSVLLRVIKECYLPLFEILRHQPAARITLNLPASLTQHLVALKQDRVLRAIRELAQNSQLELSATAAYHALLPKLPEEEIARQITLNHEINRRYLGDVFSPLGFFPPEMAYTKKVAEVINRLGLRWIILSEGALPAGMFLEKTGLYRIKETPLSVFFRHEQLSLDMAFAKAGNPNDFLTQAELAAGKEGYVIAALDGETFGHHQRGMLEFLEQFLNLENLRTARLSQLFEFYPVLFTVEPQASTWGTSFADIRRGNIYTRWDIPGNRLHNFLWRLLYLAIESVGSFPPRGETKKWEKARHFLDEGLHSDQFWWASHNPCWHFKMVKKGARLLLKAVLLSPRSADDQKREAQALFANLLSESLVLYGDTVIMC